MKLIISLLLLGLAVSSCGSETVGGGFTIPCTDDELYDQVADTCVPRARPQTNNSTDLGNNGNNGEEDMGNEPDSGIPPGCDRDNDGSQSLACGGDDCDDNTAYRSPLNFEICDEWDNDCSGVVNDGLDCTFYAHSGQILYRVDPWQKQLTELSSDLPNLQDIDTHPNGTLYGVTFDGLYKYNADSDYWSLVGTGFGPVDVEDPNGMAIDFQGTIFVTAQSNVFTIDVDSGLATLLGSMEGDFYSSGDCVVNKQDTLYMTSKHDETQDHLILLDRATGKGSEIGPIGYSRIYALTAAWGRLYGLTRDGEVITINSATGESTLVHQFLDVSFYGAASTPER